MRQTCFCIGLVLALTCIFSAQVNQKTTAPATPQAPSSNIAPALSGSGTAQYIPLWTSGTALGNSKIYQNSGDIGIGTTAPAYALDVVGRVNVTKDYRILGVAMLAAPGGLTQNLAVGNLALSGSVTGGGNTAVGIQALKSDTSGIVNTATGYNALFANTTGGYNTATGYGTLQANKTGSDNTATGIAALAANTVGFDNTATGNVALDLNTSGGFNTADGSGALAGNTTGSNNIALGFNAAIDVNGVSSNNIHIGNEGLSADNALIRLGTLGTQVAFFTAGVRGITTGLNDAVPVLIDSNGQLGTVSSSRRFKEEIHDMGEASAGLMRLRPVTFRYRKPFADGSQPMQYGLVAEEVAEVYPDLVARGSDGQIETVKYQVLDSMLLNEVQRQQAEIRELRQMVEKLQAALAAAPARLATPRD